MNKSRRTKSIYYYQDDFGEWQSIYKIRIHCWACTAVEGIVFTTAKRWFEYLRIPH